MQDKHSIMRHLFFSASAIYYLIVFEAFVGINVKPLSIFPILLSTTGLFLESQCQSHCLGNHYPFASGVDYDCLIVLEAFVVLLSWKPLSLCFLSCLSTTSLTGKPMFVLLSWQSLPRKPLSWKHFKFASSIVYNLTIWKAFECLIVLETITRLLPLLITTTWWLAILCLAHCLGNHCLGNHFLGSSWPFASYNVYYLNAQRAFAVLIVLETIIRCYLFYLLIGLPY